MYHTIRSKMTTFSHLRQASFTKGDFTRDSNSAILILGEM